MAQDGSTPAIAELNAAGIPFTEHAYAHDPSALSYGREAANALGRDPRQVLKTLIVVDAADSREIATGIVPVSTTLDLKALASVLGVKKATLAPVDVAQRVSGYVAGGISPFGQYRRLTTVVDSSVWNWPTVLVSGGKRGLDVELAPSDLVDLLNAMVQPISAR